MQIDAYSRVQKFFIGEVGEILNTFKNSNEFGGERGYNTFKLFHKLDRMIFLRLTDFKEIYYSGRYFSRHIRIDSLDEGEPVWLKVAQGIKNELEEYKRQYKLDLIGADNVK